MFPIRVLVTEVSRPEFQQFLGSEMGAGCGFCFKRKLGHIIPIKVNTTRQYADMFTKNLPHNSFVMMRKMVLGRLEDLSTPYAPEWQPANQQPDAPRTPTQE